MISKVFKKIRPTILPLLVVLILTSAYGVAQGMKGWFGMQAENKRLHTELIGKEVQFEALSKVVGKLGVKYVEQDQLRRQVTKQFSTSNQALMGRIKILSKATWAIKSRPREGQPDLVFKEGKYPYVMVEVRLDSGLPLGYVLLYEDGRVVSKAYPYSLEANTAVSRDEESGEYTILTKLAHTVRSPTVNANGEPVWFNIPYELDIAGGSAFIDPTEPSTLKSKFHWWVPRVNLMVSVGTQSEAIPGLSLSFMGYGPSTRDLDWKFLGIGASITQEEELILSLTPAYWRPFRDLLPNTYLGAGIEQRAGKFGPTFSLSVGF